MPRNYWWTMVRHPDPQRHSQTSDSDGPADCRAGGRAVAQLCTDDGQFLVSVEAPSGAERDGATVGARCSERGPAWQTGVRATSGTAVAGRLAGSVSGHLFLSRPGA